MTRHPPQVGRLHEALRSQPLDAQWRLACTPPGACATPGALACEPLEWRDAQVPGTVAGTLHEDLDVPGRYDASDWWYRTSFARPADGERHWLRFEGLATIAEVFLNGEPILSSRNMFVPRRVDVTARLRERNELAIAFRSLEAEAAPRRPRPRWKTRLVERQALRWVRTTLLGRIPAWTPAIDPVGPWGPVTLESADRVDLSEVELTTRIEEGVGRVRFCARVEALGARELRFARLRVGEHVGELAVACGRVVGEIAVPDAPAWWPHTHGEPRLVPCRLELDVGGELVTHDCGRVGFREVALDTREGAVRFRINGVPVFCRGVVWTPLDILRLHATPAELRAALTQLRDAGANMVRVGGTMAYESDDFHALCDELGLLLWQDFMLANMDYPAGDAQFRAELEAEVTHHVRRLAAHPSVVAWCGGSEVAQQAAMQGLPADAWGGELFERLLPGVVARHHAGTPYFPSTPWGGALPIHVGSGIAHYYGVGAYRRPLSDLKAARVRFATECLGLSNVPEGAPAHPPHHPRWKARVPRDSGSGYDFEDVRDFYLRELFGCDPVALRAQDLERYWAASRVTSAEVMARAYSEWRAPASGCGGALVWFHRDLWPGAGWGIVAADGTPKSPYWALRRAWAPVAVRLTDEGLDGLAIHVINDSAGPLEARVELRGYLHGRAVGTAAEAAVRVEARGAATLAADAIVGHFADATNAYRFGPPKQDVVAVRLLDAEGRVISEDFHFPAGHDLPRVHGVDLKATARRLPGGEVEVELATDHFLQAVAIECEDYTPDDNYFHVAPDAPRRVVFAPAAVAARFSARFEPLNAPGTSCHAT